MTQYAFYFDQSRCYSCHACSVACKDWNGIEAGPKKWMAVYEWEEGGFLDLRVRSLAFPCAHCEDPVCVKACKNGAIFKDEKYGAVLVDSEKCDGCRMCYRVCPYGAPKFASDAPGTKMSKCTMCVDRLEEGKQPICVMSCPLRALDFGPLDELERKYGSDRQLEGMPDPSITKPCFIVSPAKPHKELVPYDKEKALELMSKRGDLGTIFESKEAVEHPDASRIDRSSLQMKHSSCAELLANTRNNAG